MRSVYHYHSVVLDWGDVGYHYLVDWTGTIYEGRYGGPNVVGGHIRGHNPGVEGIAALGNYDSLWPSDALEQALVALVAWRTEALGLDPRGTGLLDDEPVPVLLGHRDAAQTNCPGQRLYLDLGALRGDVRNRIGYVPRLAADLLALRGQAVVEVGDRWTIAVTVQNRGTIPLAAPSPVRRNDSGGHAAGYVGGAGPSQRPRVPAGTLLLGLGTADEIAAARQAAAQASGRDADAESKGDEGPDAPRESAPLDPAAGYPYRWTLPRSVPPGETATLSVAWRPRQVGRRLLGATLYREAGDLLLEHPPDLTTQVLPAPAAVRLADAATVTRLAFPWLDDDPQRGQRRLAAVNLTAEPLDLRWTVAGVAGAPTFAARLPGYGAARWDEAGSDLAAAMESPWPTRPAAAPPAPSQPRPPARDVAAGLLEAARGATAALRLRAPSDGDESADARQCVAYVGVADSGARLWIPLLGEGWATEISVQNLAERPVVAEVAWHGPTGEQAVRRQIAPGAAAIFPAPANATSGHVQAADGAILAALALASPTTGGTVPYPLPSSAERALYLPALGQVAGWTSAVQLHNPGDGAVEVAVQWEDYAGGRRWQDRVTLAAGGSTVLRAPVDRRCRLAPSVPRVLRPAAACWRWRYYGPIVARPISSTRPAGRGGRPGPPAGRPAGPPRAAAHRRAKRR